MKKIGMIAAMQEEFDVVKALLTDIDVVKKYNLEFCCGKLNEKDIVCYDGGRPVHGRRVPGVGTGDREPGRAFGRRDRDDDSQHDHSPG